jgi:hypothetical protein
MKKLIVIASLLLAGCSDSTPVARYETNNPDVPVQRLFDFDGCRVYRFWDGGIRHFFVRCAGGPIQTLKPDGGKIKRSEKIETIMDDTL